jgi:aerobic-type carbon monoxide dehydrogenase small subunit (CoxS/CutS family)
VRPLSFALNGRAVEVVAPEVSTLATVLRDHLGVTGTKIGCEQGNCGACTVHLDGRPVNACLVLAATVEGRSVETVEGIGTPDRPHPLQAAFTEHYGAQCGFCTSGMLMAAKALLDRVPDPTREDVVEALAGNLCRCTGYHKIVESVVAAAGGRP